MTTGHGHGRGLGGPFHLFLIGQFVSNLGSAVSLVVLPLLVYRLTGSPVRLGLATAAEFLPYPLFGLLIGAWVDRASRRRVMITADVVRMLAVATVPLAAADGRLSVWWIYLVGFVMSTCTIAFDAAEFAAVTAMVPGDRLAEANGRLSAVYSTAGVAGPAVAGLALVAWTLPAALLVDAASFAVSVACLLALRRALPAVLPGEAREPIGASIRTGLRFVFGHPVLRATVLMLALTNFFIGGTVAKQIVVLAAQRFAAGNGAVSWLFLGENAGVVVFSLLAVRLAARLPTTAALMLPFFGGAVCIAACGLARPFAAVVLIWALGAGFGTSFVLTMRTLRQRLTPPDMLGRVATASQVVSWSLIPVGALLGGWLTAATGSAATVFIVLGAVQALIACAFLAGPLGHADRHLTAASRSEPVPEPQPAPA